MPRIPIEPDSRLTRPNPQRVEWAMYTMRRQYRNAVKMTARYIGACCQCGRIAEAAGSDDTIQQCFHDSGFGGPPMCMVCLWASDRMNRVPEGTRNWADVAFNLFRADVRNEVCRLGIDPSDGVSIHGAAMAAGSPQWERACRHPHPFGRPLRRVEEPHRPPTILDEAIADFRVSPRPAPTFDEIEPIIQRERADRIARVSPAQQANPAPAGWAVAPTTTSQGFTYLSTDFLDAPWSSDVPGRPTPPPATAAGQVDALNAYLRERPNQYREPSGQQAGEAGRPTPPDDDAPY